jgi:V8-like Glu-specific endopeptidase
LPRGRVFFSYAGGIALKKPLVTGVLVVVWAVGCGSADAPPASRGEPVAHSSSAIQGGAADTTHNFAVGVVEVQTGSQAVAFCSGVLLAPNLVATARHCVSQVTSAQIDCATTSFTSTVPVGNLYVTPDPTISNANGHNFYTVVSLSVPSGPGTSGVCGNDIALLTLSNTIPVPQYVTPTINPPMTDHQAYTTAVTAIGYGVDTPTDTMGASAGVRRIRENINLVCIPHDKTPADCFSDPQAAQYISPNEFEGGDGTCEGDSGSGAYDQGSFNKGQWVAFGVLSRGGVSPEGGTCLGSIYTRFDAWSQLLIDAAGKAAALGGYSPPSWTGLPPSPAVDGAAPSPGTSADGGSGVACQQSGTLCSADTDCCTVNCISSSGDKGPFSCTACDLQHPCNQGYGCRQGVCVSGAPSSFDAGSGDGGGLVEAGVRAHAACAVGLPGSSGPLPGRAAAAGFAAIALVLRRRKPRGA